MDDGDCVLYFRSLVQDMERPKTEQLDQTVKAESRPPHHDALYRLVSVQPAGVQRLTKCF